MSETNREVLRNFTSKRIVKISCDFSNPIFIIERSIIDAMGQTSWIQEGEINEDGLDMDRGWIYELLCSLK